MLNNKNKKLNKKAQEEMFGFVLVVLVITLVLAAFLVISLKKPSKPITRESIRTSNLLNAALYLTTECDNKDLAEVIVACVEEELSCLEQGGACQYATDLTKKVISEQLKGKYAFSVKKEDATGNQTVITHSRGDCPSKGQVLKSGSAFSTSTGIIRVELFSCI